MARYSQSRRQGEGQGRHREWGLKEAQSETAGDEQKPDTRRDASGTSGQSRPREALWVRDREALGFGPPASPYSSRRLCRHFAPPETRLS